MSRLQPYLLRLQPYVPRLRDELGAANPNPNLNPNPAPKAASKAGRTPKAAAAATPGSVKKATPKKKGLKA